MPNPLPAAAEKFAAIVSFLGKAAGAQTGWGISLQLIALITSRLLRISQCVRRIAAKIQAGTYRPRTFVHRRPPAERRPRPPDSLDRLYTKPGWLLPLLPQAMAARCWLETALADPEMAALMAAAPKTLGRPIRSLCRMLRVEPPPIIGPPRRPRKPAPAAKPQRQPPKPAYPEPPAWLRGMPRSARWQGSRRRRPAKTS